MRKLFLAMAAVAALLASCSKDDAVIDTPTEGTETTVTFEVSSPELATRYGEGNNATVLEWYVYEFDGSNYKNVAGLYGTKTFQKETTVGIKFLMGRTYHVLFWAHAEDAPYEVDPSDATMTVDYAKLTANNEDYDAFYKFHEVGLVTTATQGGTVELTRPFAQLNVATSDTDDAAKAGYTLDKTGITVKVYGKMDFKTGEVDKSTLAERTFTPATKATGTVTVGGTTYDVISMNYLLVNQKETPDVKLSLLEANSDETLERVYTTVPVQRNYRTYILGNVFTKPAEFTVVIKEGFLDNHYEEWDGTTYEEIEDGEDGYFSVSHAAELAYIFETVDKSNNDVKIRLEADINFGGHTIPAWSGDNNINGYKVVLEGNGNRIFNFKSAAVGTRATADYQIAGLFDIACGAEISNLTIENATVDAGNSAESFAGALIGKVSAGVAKLTNVTVLNSSVTGTCKVGGLVGFATADDACLEIENCHVKNTNITTNDVAGESGQAGGLVGYIANGKNTISNSSVVGGTFNVVNSRNNEEKANSKFVGVVAGSTELVIENYIIDETGMTYNETGATSYVSPYGDFVGGNRGTATVVIDGAEYVVDADGDLTLDGAPVITNKSTAADFIDAVKNGGTVILASDITFDGSKGNYLSIDDETDEVVIKGVDGATVNIKG